MASWLTNTGWQSTEPVDRFKTLLDQTMTISVAGTPAGHPPESVEGLVSLVERGGRDGAMDGERAPVQTQWGLPDVTLTDPVALGPLTRLAFGGLCGFALLAALGAVIALAAGGTRGTAPYVVLGLIGGMAALGAVVLVMGWRSVTISSGAALARAGAPR